MSLPRREHPIFELKLPSNGKTVRYRPFMVREEKILLMAAQGGEYNNILRAIKQIIAACLVDELDVDTLPLFDIEYFFLQLRARSVNNIVEQTWRDKEDNKLYTFQIDLDTIKVVFPETEKRIKFSDEMGIIMKYPPTNFTNALLESQSLADAKFEMVKLCLDKLWVGEELFDFSDETDEEVNRFLEEDVGPVEYAKLFKFVSLLPHIEHRITYKNSEGNDKEIVMDTLSDFFTWG